MRFLFSLLLLLASQVFAQETGLQPGSYSKSEADLSIKREATGEISFQITAVSGIGHICALEGSIHAGRAALHSSFERRANQPACMVDFVTSENGIEVKSNGPPCLEFCGAGASFENFEGIYIKPPSGCDGSGLTQTRNDFQRAYDNKAFAEARKILEPVLARCAMVMGRYYADSIRNDLAITQYHLHDYAGCKNTLESFREETSKSDEQLKSQYSAFEEGSRLPIVRAARTNLKLCDKPTN